MSPTTPPATRRLLVAFLVTTLVTLGLSAATAVKVFSAPLRTVSVPTGVGFEGYVVDAVTGAPLNGPHDLTFQLYTVAESGTPLAWTNVLTDVTVTDGLYSVLLSSLPVSEMDGDRWLGVTVDSATEISPRTRLGSVPFALNAQSAAEAPWDGLTGIPSDIADGDHIGTGTTVTGGDAGRVPVFNTSTTPVGATGLTFSSNNLSVAGGVNAGSATGAATGHLAYSGALQPYQNSQLYTAYAYVPLTTRLVSTAWDGDARSDVSTSTALNLSTVFGLPANVKAVVVRIVTRDSGTWPTVDLYFSMGPSSTYSYACSARPAGADVYAEASGAVCPTDGNSTVYYRINASGASTLDVHLEIWGYYL